MRARVVVIGAGISGLACAWRLRRSGLEVEVLEAGERAGGVIATRCVEGFLVETGPTTVQASDDLLELVQDAGLEQQRLEADRSLARYVFFRGRLHRAPLGPLSLLATGLLSTRAKLRVIAEPWIPPRADSGDESVAAFFRRRFGREPHDVLVAPFVSGIFAGDTTKLGIAGAFPALADLEARFGSVVRGAILDRARKPRSVVSFRDGLATLTTSLAEDLNVRFGKAVTSVVAGQGRNSIRCASDPETRDADAVVLAVPAERAAPLVGEVAPEAARLLASFESPPLAVVAFAYRRADVPRDLSGFGFLVPRGQGIRLLGCLWSSSIFAGRAPDGEVLLTCFIGGATDPEAAALDDRALAALVAEDLRRGLGIVAAPRVLAIERHARSIPQYAIGHRQRIDRIRREIARVPGFFLAGNYLGGVSVGDCVRQANETAGAVRRFFG